MSKTVNQSIIDVQLTNEGNLVLICAPSALNAKGAYVMNAAQTARILQRAGIPNVYALKHLVAITNGTTKMSMEVEECKAGDAWVNAKNNTSGTYEKDWTKLSNHGIELGWVAKQKLVDASLAGAFNNANNFVQAAPRVQAPAAVAVETNDNDLGIKGTDETAKTEEAPKV